MDLTVYRDELDQIDDQILALFLRRMEIVQDIARYKIANELPVLHPQRESEILDRVGQKAGTEMAPHAKALFEDIMACSRTLQQKLMAEK